MISRKLNDNFKIGLKTLMNVQVYHGRSIRIASKLWFCINIIHVTIISYYIPSSCLQLLSRWSYGYGYLKKNSILSHFLKGNSDILYSSSDYHNYVISDRKTWCKRNKNFKQTCILKYSPVGYLLYESSNVEIQKDQLFVSLDTKFC